MSKKEHAYTGIHRWMRRFILILACIILTLAGVVHQCVRYFDDPGPLPRMTTVLIPKGSGFNDIAKLLEDNRIIRHPFLFKVMTVVQGNGRNFKAGEYEFHPMVSPRAVMEAMLEGKTLIRKLTVPEGLTTTEILALLRDNSRLTGEMPVNISEGTLLPETYHYSYGDERRGILERMLNSHKRVLDRLWVERDLSVPLKSPEEAVILASIVEKETGLKDERGRIAAAFINRLRAGMKLQADPTVIYALTDGDRKLDKPLTGADLKVDSPYNTYQNYGLPPGPICNPGEAALRAVLKPPATKEIYFVADGKGGHNFAVTLKDHNRNVTKYRTILKSVAQ